MPLTLAASVLNLGRLMPRELCRPTGSLDCWKTLTPLSSRRTSVARWRSTLLSSRRRTCDLLHIVGGPLFGS